MIGTDPNRGRPFCERGNTSIVSRHGAVIIVNSSLATDQELTIRCLSNNKEAEVRVVGPIAGPDNERFYGVEFLDPAVNLWGIEFPSLTGAEDALARILLRCSLCQATEVAHLDEIEIQVFDETQSIQRFCKHCSATTAWKPGPQDADEPISQSDKGTPEPSAAPPTPVQNKRKYNRIKTTMSACIRQPGFPEEIVICENLSRGGLRFRSPSRYLPGSRIEVAVPYSAGSGNIFVPARIVYVQEFGNLFAIGAAYVGASAKEQRSQYEGSASAER